MVGVPGCDGTLLADLDMVLGKHISVIVVLAYVLLQVS